MSCMYKLKQGKYNSCMFTSAASCCMLQSFALPPRPPLLSSPHSPPPPPPPKVGEQGRLASDEGHAGVGTVGGGSIAIRGGCGRGTVGEYHKGNFQEAFKHLRLAVKRDTNLNYDEPWGWMTPARHVLGALLLEQGEAAAEAEEVYREDLKQFKGNLWSLLGLHQALKCGRGSVGGRGGCRRGTVGG